MDKLIVPFAAIGKPRMTAKSSIYSDTAKRYWEWKDAMKIYAKSKGFKIGNKIAIRAVFEMPKSWSKKKRLEMVHTVHEQKPDFDNIAKAVCDALHADDKCVSDGLSVKRWGVENYFEIVNLSNEKANEIERLAFND